MIQTWIADITPLYEEENYHRIYESLPDFRQEKADRISCLNNKAQSAGAWALLERVRAEYNIMDEAVFNLSHSGDFVVCSIDTGRGDALVGCDLEKIKDTNLKVARRFFCPSEYEYICTQADEEKKKEMFCRFWVLKESFMKATRKGMALDMQSFEIEPGTPPVLIKKPEEFEREFYYREYAVPKIPYRIAVCSTDQNIDPQIHTELLHYFSEAEYE